MAKKRSLLRLEQEVTRATAGQGASRLEGIGTGRAPRQGTHGHRRPQACILSKVYDSGAPISLRYSYARQIVAPFTDWGAGLMAAGPTVEPFSGPPAPSVERAAVVGGAPAVPAPPVVPVPAAQPGLEPEQSPPPLSRDGLPAQPPAEDDLEADIRAILGAPGGVQPSPGPPSAQPSPAPTGSQAPGPARAQSEDVYSVFDRMGYDMRHANAFNLGTVEVDRRLDGIERALDQEEAARARPTVQALNLASALDDLELLADIVEIGEAAPAEPGDQEPGAVKDEPSAVAPQPAVSEPAAPHPAAPHPADQEPAQDDGSPSAVAIRHKVPPVVQGPGLSVAAAAAATLIAWREGYEPSTTAIVEGTGPWARYRGALAVKGTEMLDAWGLTQQPVRTYSPEELGALLDAHGPLWAAPPGSVEQARVIAGIAGDGSPEGTSLWIRDPSGEGTTRKKRYHTFLETLSDTDQGELWIAHL